MWKTGEQLIMAFYSAFSFALHKRKSEEKAEEYSLDEKMKQIAEEEEKLRAYRSEKRREKKRKNEESFVDPEVASAMGFGGFGKRSKWNQLPLYIFFVNILPKVFSSHSGFV